MPVRLEEKQEVAVGNTNQQIRHCAICRFLSGRVDWIRLWAFLTMPIAMPIANPTM
ncbi:hypothetical protein Csa_001010, partial [Cucumis sativus]